MKLIILLTTNRKTQRRGGRPITFAARFGRLSIIPAVVNEIRDLPVTVPVLPTDANEGSLVMTTGLTTGLPQTGSGQQGLFLSDCTARHAAEANASIAALLLAASFAGPLDEPIVDVPSHDAPIPASCG